MSYVFPLFPLPPYPSPAPTPASGAAHLLRRAELCDHIREMGFDPDREPPFFFNSRRTQSSHRQHARLSARDPELRLRDRAGVAIGKAGRTSLARRRSSMSSATRSAST